MYNLLCKVIKISPYLKEFFVFMENVVLCSALLVSESISISNMWISCQFTFISVQIPLQPFINDSAASWVYKNRCYTCSTLMSYSPMTFFPRNTLALEKKRREEKRFSINTPKALGCLCCPLLDITFPVEQMRERKWMPACAFLMAKLSQL